MRRTDEWHSRESSGGQNQEEGRFMLSAADGFALSPLSLKQQRPLPSLIVLRSRWLVIMMIAPREG